jgi:hypothetical protein
LGQKRAQRGAFFAFNSIKILDYGLQKSGKSWNLAFIKIIVNAENQGIIGIDFYYEVYPR